MAQLIAAHHSMPSTSAQILLELDHPPLEANLAFSLGWDHAHYGLTPPAERLFADATLRQGWLAGRASFGQRTLKPSRHVRLWLELRSHACLRGIAFEDVQVTPNYLQQISTDWCPIRRVALDQDTAPANRRSIDRVRSDAAYAAGNLAMMSHGANTAKHHHSWQSVTELVSQLEQTRCEQSSGLCLPEWRRVATLCSYVTDLSHEQAAVLPMLVLPPNRLRLFNPIQALQAWVTRQLATPGWSERLDSLLALLPNASLKRDFNAFVLAIVPRILLAGKQSQDHALRWALEDAWSTGLVQRRWAQFALGLSAAQAELLVTRAADNAPGPLRVQQHACASATEGWALERGGLHQPDAPSRAIERTSKPRRLPLRPSSTCH
jgi:hypothetical protein